MSKYAAPLLFAAILLLIVLPTRLTQAAASGPAFEVDSLGGEPDSDTADGNCLTASGTCTLNAAIQQANELNTPTTITFAVTGVIVGPLVASTVDIVIDGPGINDLTIATFLSLGNKGSGEPPATAVVKDLSISNPSGVGLNLTRTNAELSTVRVHNNARNGIVDGGFTLTIVDSIIEDNGDTFIGIPSNGGAINSDSILTIHNSVIRNNRGYNGGAIWHNGSQIEIINSEISGNTAGYPATTAAAGGGGGLYLGSGSATIVDSTIHRNAAASTGASANGGGIYFINDTAVDIRGTAIMSNTADFDGAGIYTSTSANIHGSIRNLNINNNIAGDDGGGIFLDGNTQGLEISNVTISSNTASSGTGGGVRLKANTHITYTTIYNNTGSGLDGGGSFSTVSNSIIGKNASGGAPDCAALNLPTFVGANMDTDGSCGVTVTDTSPNLGPLQFNGGRGMTHALPSDSPALNAGDGSVCASAPIYSLDQRLFGRSPSDGCDLGAHENMGVPTAIRLQRAQAATGVMLPLSVLLLCCTLSLITIYRRFG